MKEKNKPQNKSTHGKDLQTKCKKLFKKTKNKSGKLIKKAKKKSSKMLKDLKKL